MIPTDSFRQLLLGLPRFQNADWIGQLEDRKLEEVSFHDEDRRDHRDEMPGTTANRRFYAATAPVFAHVDAWFSQEVPGHVFLDFACGGGSWTIRAAELGASVAVGIDISPVSIKNAVENAERKGKTPSPIFLQRDCEATELPDASFDRILCSGMLHHLDLRRAFPELRRICRPGARILCVEALAYNPAIQLYRQLTPQYRTEWEKNHILTLKGLRLAERWFTVENLRFFCLVSPLVGFLPRIMRPLLLPGLHALDAVLTRIPGLQLWSWQFSFELTVPSE